MKPVFRHVLWDHGIFGVLTSMALMPFYGWKGSAAFFLASILIDLDHYLFFLIEVRFRRWSVGDMFRFHEEIFPRCHRPEFLKLEYFHNIEFFFLAACAAFFGGGLWVPVFLGFVFHAVTDTLFLARNRIFSKRCNSLIEYLWRFRELRRQGLDPGVIYREALQAAGLLQLEPGRKS